MPAVRTSAPARRAVALAVSGAGLCALGGCTLFGGGGAASASVFELEPGDCVRTPDEVMVELTDLETVACDEPHEQEVYALVDMPEPSGDAAGSSFPGDAALKDFADGACAERFEGYVGVDYRDSTLYFTYLVPSARSWQDDGDRTVVCLVTTTGEQLTQSVEGSQW